MIILKITGITILLSILTYSITGIPMVFTLMPILATLLLLIGVIRLGYKGGV
jgi:hypothetical protein